MNWEDILRAFIIVAFAGLAILLPTAIRVHAREERRADALLLAWTIWAIYAAGILAILHRIGEPLTWDTTLVRLVSLALGYVYLCRNLRRRRDDPRCRHQRRKADRAARERDA